MQISDEQLLNIPEAIELPDDDEPANDTEDEEGQPSTPSINDLEFDDDFF